MTALDNSQTAAGAAVPEWLRAGESRLRLHTIVRLRWLAVFGQSLTVIGAYWALGMDVPIGGCFAVIALSAWLNVALRIRFPASQRLKSNYALIMLGYDIVQLAALLFLTGGVENPFVFLLIAPVTVSASTLPLRITVALGVLAIGAASLLTVYHYPLPWFSGQSLALPFPYVLGVWASVVSGILFIGFYSWRTAEEGRRMAEALAAAEMVLAREHHLRGGQGFRHAPSFLRRAPGIEADKQNAGDDRGPHAEHVRERQGEALPAEPGQGVVVDGEQARSANGEHAERHGDPQRQRGGRHRDRRDQQEDERILDPAGEKQQRGELDDVVAQHDERVIALQPLTCRKADTQSHVEPRGQCDHREAPADRHVHAERPIGADDREALPKHGKPAQTHDGVQTQTALAGAEPLRNGGAGGGLTIVECGHR